MDPRMVMGNIDPEMLSEMMGHLFLNGTSMMPNMFFHTGVGDDDEEEEDDDDGDGLEGPRPKALDANSCRDLLHRLRDRAASLPSRVAALHRLLTDLHHASQPPAAMLSETSLQLLNDLVTREWPPNGDLAASASERDVVVAVRPPAPPAPPPAGGGSGGNRRRGGGGQPPPPLPVWRLPHHSLRRVATGVVAELCRWPKPAEALRRQGFFAALPPLLRDLAARYRFGQSYRRMYGRGQATDQGQYILERLVAACGIAAGSNAALRRYCAETLLEPLVRFYPRLDARRAKYLARRRLRPRPEDDSLPGGAAPAYADFADDSSDAGSDAGTDSGAEAGLGIGGSGGGARRGRPAANGHPGAEVPELEYGLGDGGEPRWALRRRRRRRRPQCLFEAMCEDVEPPGPSERDPLPTAFLRFLGHAWGELSKEQQERYLSGGIVAALAAFPLDPRLQMAVEGPVVLDMRVTYNRMALRSFAHVRAADESLRERATRLRLRGNEAFKAGLYEQALSCYTNAVALDWDEPTHRNNRCFALLKLGRLAAARYEGNYSVRCDPRNARSWSRLAAVYEAMQQWQLAQLCYAQALALMRPRTDDELQERLREAEKRLQGVQPWRFESIPPQGPFEARDKWRAWIGRHLPQAQLRAMDAVWGLSTPDMLGVDPTGGLRAVTQNPLLAAAGRSEAYQASAMLRPLWEAACSIEEAARAPMDYALRINTSWTDTATRDRDTGLVYYTVSCMSAADGSQRAFGQFTPGKPRFPALRNSYCLAIARPIEGKPARPSSILVAHRAVPYIGQLKAFFDPMGVKLVCESLHEAVQSAANYNTDPTGYNQRDHYSDEYRAPDEDLPMAPGARPQPSTNDALSDDDTSVSYRLMLADTAVTGGAGRDGGDTAAARPSGGDGSSGSAAAAAPVMPSDAQVRAATEALLKVVDPGSCSVRQLRACLCEKFGIDVASKNGLIREMAARAGIRA
ncbi:hypothetical protein PLESTB_001463500 [Pleodorina starrii]|uniref:Uncharacterized protein n=1 Tax=Pleodorina starrii TaxID=330485 RepID=A0A9W6F852_9CHLO|nr:hypothetical protein PLESTM_001681600 [Pleodorina starrii]GLC59221.1 hypothetical protein PLESTB_001463500 [Pleodorina starrii]GLC74784.1 hypothetical protein PLESTF_001555900 [Pleodorina starrii]